MSKREEKPDENATVHRGATNAIHVTTGTEIGTQIVTEMTETIDTMTGDVTATATETSTDEETDIGLVADLRIVTPGKWIPLVIW